MFGSLELLKESADPPPRIGRFFVVTVSPNCDCPEFKFFCLFDNNRVNVSDRVDMSCYAT